MGICVEISNNLHSEKFITSTVDLDNQNIVADKKINLEFKDVLNNSGSNRKLNSKVAAKYKEVEIFDNYKSSKYQPIGKGSYSVVENGIELTKPYSTSRGSFTQNKTVRNYQTKNLTPPGSIVNKIF
jgi:hypothetical protein